MVKVGQRIRFKKSFTVWRKPLGLAGLCDVCLKEAAEKGESSTMARIARYRIPVNGETAGFCEEHWQEYVEVELPH
jgi:hypothetical protein